MRCVDVEPEPVGPSPTVFEAASPIELRPCGCENTGICATGSCDSSESELGPCVKVYMNVCHNKHNSKHRDTEQW